MNKKNAQKKLVKRLEENPFEVLSSSEEIRNNKEICLDLVNKSAYAFEYFSEELKNDKDVVRKTLNKNIRMILFVSNELKDDREFMSEYMNIKPVLVFNHLSSRLKKDLEFLKLAVSHSGEIVKKYAPFELRNDKDFMLFAIKYSAFCFEDCSTMLKTELKFIEECVEIQPGVLNYIKDTYLTEKTLIRMVSKNGLCYEYLSVDSIYKLNENIIFAAIKNNGLTLKFIENPSEKITLMSIWNTWEAFEFAPISFKNDKKFILEAVSENGEIYQHISKKLKGNKEIVLKSLKKSSEMFKFVPKMLKNDMEVFWISKKYSHLIRDLDLKNISFTFI